jgi:flagellar hook-associated protein FlgK
MDEEVANMVMYQRGFDAAAKFINVVDEMTKTVINL